MSGKQLKFIFVRFYKARFRPKSGRKRGTFGVKYAFGSAFRCHLYQPFVRIRRALRRKAPRKAYEFGRPGGAPQLIFKLRHVLFAYHGV
jgi:hypothetical protein